MQFFRRTSFSGVALLCLCLLPAVRAQGIVSVWGWNAYGQLGDGSLTDAATPVQLSSVSGVTAVAGGFYHSLALKSDGTVWAWGRNDHGQLGNGTNTSSDVPVQVTGLANVIAIAAGGDHSLALKNDGTVWTWGWNGNGQLGDGTLSDSSIPVQVTGLAGIIAISGGGAHSLALANDGTLWAWGANGFGQLGDGTSTDSATPISILTDVTAIAAGDFHSLALKSDSTVWSWGYNYYGQLGNGTFDVAAPYGNATPSAVPGLGGVTAIAAGYYHSLALKSDGTVWAWGFNLFGELGNSTYTTAAPFGSDVPVRVTALTGVAALAAGAYHSMALRSDGTVWAWGFNYYGQLGNSTAPANSDSPVQVPGLAGVTSIAAGGSHSIALQAPPTVNNLITEVTAATSGFTSGQTNSLTSKLQAAFGYLQAGDTADATSTLQAFINEINALVRSGRLSATDAAPFLLAANAMIALL
jgi:alpha-tubulin suppressor-like RCC1 family protein